MLNRQSTNVNLRKLYMNLRDLDDISRKVAKEFDKKNQIIVGGLKDSRLCQLYVDRTIRKKKME